MMSLVLLAVFVVEEDAALYGLADKRPGEEHLAATASQLGRYLKWR